MSRNVRILKSSELCMARVLIKFIYMSDSDRIYSAALFINSSKCHGNNGVSVSI